MLVVGAGALGAEWGHQAALPSGLGVPASWAVWRGPSRAAGSQVEQEPTHVLSSSWS